MKTKIMFGGLITLVLAFLVWFGFGGGFATVEVNRQKDYSLTIYGLAYSGSLQSKEASMVFDKVEKQLQGKPMYVFYDGEPTKENDYSVNMLIGSVEQFEGAVKESVRLGEVYMARHESYFVLNKAQTEIMNQAKEDDVQLDMSKMVEIYYTKNDLERIIPVFKK